MSAPFGISEHAAATGAACLTVTGELDTSTSEGLRELILNALDADGLHELLIDLTAVPQLHSTGVAALITGRNTAAQRGIGYRIVNYQHLVHPRPAPTHAGRGRRPRARHERQRGETSLLTITTGCRSDAVQIIAAGDVGYDTAPIVRRSITAELTAPTTPAVVVVDLGAVTFLDCAGVSVLLTGRQLATDRDHHLPGDRCRRHHPVRAADTQPAHHPEQPDHRVDTTPRDM